MIFMPLKSLKTFLYLLKVKTLQEYYYLILIAGYPMMQVKIEN